MNSVSVSPFTVFAVHNRSLKYELARFSCMVLVSA